MGGEGFLRIFDYGDSDRVKKGVLFPGSALVQAETNILQFAAHSTDEERERSGAG